MNFVELGNIEVVWECDKVFFLEYCRGEKIQWGEKF